MAGVKGRSGPRPQPTHLHVVTDTFRADRHAGRADAADVPALRAPRVPDWLGPEARKTFRRLARLVIGRGIMTDIDADALAITADAYVQYQRASEELAERGVLVEIVGKDGVARLAKNPVAAVVADTWRRTELGLSRFGLNPVARASIKVLEPPRSHGLAPKPKPQA